LNNKEKKTDTYKPKGNSDDGNASVTTIDSSDRSEVLVAFAGCANNGDELIFDSAASFHICINRDWFITYDSVQDGSVRMGDDSIHQITALDLLRLRCMMTLSEL
jgi:hypothetical protein